MLFIGKEQEGIYKGLWTLFVGKEYTLEDIKKNISIHNIKHIYLGAGRSYLTILSEQDIQYLLDNNFLISYETDMKPNLSEDILKRINCIYTIKSFPIDLSWLLFNHCIKIEDTNHLFIIPIKSVIYTSLNKLIDNTHYEGDVILKK